MSQATAVRAPARTPARGIPRAPQQPRLRVVDLPAHTRSRAGLVVTCVTILVLGLVALLVLNVSLERGAYELRSQRLRTAQLAEQRQALQEQLAALQAPEALADKAASLGMVPAPNVAFLRKSDGTVLGVPSRAVAVRQPTVTSGGGAAASPARSPATTTSPSARSGAASPRLGVTATVAPSAKAATTKAATTKAATTKAATTPTAKATTR